MVSPIGCQQQAPFSGRIDMKLSSALKALGFLCVLSADGFPVSQEESPEIIGPSHVQIKAHPGEQLVLHCDAITNCDDDEALIYWLVNGSFPEDTLGHGRIEESNESAFKAGSILQKNLLLKKVTLEDLECTFSCVVTNAVGIAQKFITLTASGCSSE